MSQAAMQPQPTSVPPAFRKAPAFLSAQPQPPEQPVAQAPEAAPAPQPEPMIIPAPRQRGSIILPSSQPTSTAATPPTGGEQPGSEPSAAAPSAAETPAAPSSDDKVLARQLEAERLAYAQREQQWAQAMQAQREQLAAAQQGLAEYEAFKRQAELQQQLSSDELYAGLETVDADDARKITQVAAQVYQPQLEAMRQQLAQQGQALQQSQQYMQQQMAALQSERTRNELLAAHPDFMELYATPAFRQYLSQRDGLSSRTREEQAIAEYNAGNAAFVIDMINRYKGVVPRVENIQQVAPVQVASAAAPAAVSAPVQPQDTVPELLSLVQTRQITPDEFRARMGALRAAQTQRPV